MSPCRYYSQYPEAQILRLKCFRTQLLKSLHLDFTSLQKGKPAGCSSSLAEVAAPKYCLSGTESTSTTQQQVVDLQDLKLRNCADRQFLG